MWERRNDGGREGGREGGGRSQGEEAVWERVRCREGVKERDRGEEGRQGGRE